MRDFYYVGWCCGDGCREAATERLAVRIGDLTHLVVPVCEDHMARAKADIEAMRGHSLCIAAEDER